MRENTHLTFKFTPRTIGYGLVFGVAVPCAIYYAIVSEFVTFQPCGVFSLSIKTMLLSR